MNNKDYWGQGGLDRLGWDLENLGMKIADFFLPITELQNFFAKLFFRTR